MAVTVELPSEREYRGAIRSDLCTDACMIEVQTQYRIEYNADAIVAFHNGVLVSDPILLNLLQSTQDGILGVVLAGLRDGIRQQHLQQIPDDAVAAALGVKWVG